MTKHEEAIVREGDGGLKKSLHAGIIGMAFVAMLSMYLFSGCVYRGPHGESISIIPDLPVSIELLDSDPYYYQNGYYYYYHDNAWSYSHSRGGPWMDLPRSHYPRDVKFRHEGGNGGDRDQYQGDRH